MPHTVLATFCVKSGFVTELGRQLDRHWRAIRERGYGEGPDPIRLVRHHETGPILYEIFDWRDGAIASAASDQAICDIWAAIDACCEARAGMSATNFPRVERVIRAP
jgi:hypothetical protein